MPLSFNPTEEREYTEKEARELWTEARRMAEAEKCDFRVWQFPEDPDNIGFSGATFNRSAWFEYATFIGDTDFEGATFNGSAWFAEVTFGGCARFTEATFGKDAGSTEAPFSGDAGVERFSFNKATFSGDAWFEGAKFNGGTSFIEATFGGDPKFNGDADFEGATFSGDAKFNGAKFNGSASFDRATFENNVDFSLPHWIPWRLKPFSQHYDAAIAYRHAKQASQDHGDYRMAGKYHFAEQCATNASELKEGIAEGNPVKITASFIELIFARLLFGYGEKPQNPLIAALFVIFLWAFLFWHFSGIEPDSQESAALGQTTTVASATPSKPEIKNRKWEECLYFSIVTFTTLGYGDMRPTDDIGHRLLAGSEALLGVAIMALFIVSLARKYTR